MAAAGLARPEESQRLQAAWEAKKRGLFLFNRAAEPGIASPETSRRLDRSAGEWWDTLRPDTQAELTRTARTEAEGDAVARALHEGREPDWEGLILRGEAGEKVDPRQWFTDRMAEEDARWAGSGDAPGEHDGSLPSRLAADRRMAWLRTVQPVTGEPAEALGGQMRGFLGGGGFAAVAPTQTPIEGPWFTRGVPEVVPRRNMEVDRRFGTPIYGSAKSTSGTKWHDESIQHFGETLAKSGKFKYVLLQRSWRTASGRDNSKSRLLPDVIAVSHDGKVHAWEVQSNSDKGKNLRARLNLGLKSLPKKMQGKIDVIKPYDSKLRKPTI
jgi:hypothetical protein